MKLRTKAIPFVFLPIVVLLGMLTLLAGFSDSYHESEISDRESDTVILASESLLSHLGEAQVATLGFIASGNAGFLDAFPQQIALLGSGAKQIERLSAHDRSQHARAVELSVLVKQAVALLYYGVSRSKAGHRSEILKGVATLQGRKLTARVRNRVAVFIASEKLLQTIAKQRVVQKWQRLTLSFFVVGIVVTVLYLIMALAITGRIGKRLERLGHEANLAALGEQGGRLDPSRDEIGDLGRTLQAIAAEVGEKNTVSTRYRMLFENTRDMLLFVDQDTHRIIDANLAVLDAYGYSREEFNELTLDDIRPPEERVKIPEMIAGAIDGGVLIETQGLRRDGTTFPIEATMRSGIVNGRQVVFGIGRDVSERKQHELDLSRALAQAVDATNTKSEFVATVSHELRTPLNGVVGMGELLLLTQLDGNQRECAQTMHDSSVALLRIINDILDFSKLDAGQVTLEKMDFGLAPLVEGVVELVSRSKKCERVNMMAYVGADIPLSLQGDPGRLRQILLNLVGNAAKFTSAGSLLVSATLQSVDDGRVSVAFEVSDTGVGMTPEVQARLFTPFSQGDVSTTRRFGGTGLGLVIAKAYVELMGGTIQVESAVGVGTKVRFTIELDAAAADTPRVDVSSMKDLRLLIVDGESATRTVLEQYAKGWNVAYSSAANAADALTQLRSAASLNMPFDCAIIEHRLPGISGLELGSEIKKDPAIASTRLMVLASDDDGGAESAQAGGFSAYLATPVTQSHVYDQLVAMMSPHDAACAIEAVQAVRVELLHHRLDVLLAEDNLVNRRVAERQLTLLGCTATWAENGQVAVDANACKRYDVILMDCNMPVLDGFAATKQIRAVEAAEGLRHVPIVAMTANASAADRERCLGAGMDDYVSKPVLLEALRVVLQRVEPWTETPQLTA